MNEQGNSTNNVSNPTNAGNPVASVNTTPQPVSSSITNTDVVSQPVNSNTTNTNVVSQPVNPNTTNMNVISQSISSNTANTAVVPQQVNSSVANTGVVSQPVSSNTVSPGVMSHPTGPSIINESDKSSNIPQNNQSYDSSKTGDKASNYKPPGVFKSLILILFFGGLVAFIIFLPEIQAYVADYMSGNTGASEITSGKLKCSLETNTTNFNKTFERVFVFSDKKLQSATFTSITKGDITEDEEALDQLNEVCKLKKDAVSTVGGVNVVCEYSNGLLTEREHFDYKNFNIETVKAAYAEAGADVIEYEYGYDIDKINTAMLQAGFTCKKEK